MLEKFLKKIGVSSFTELNEEERRTYQDWEASLSGRRLTDEDVKRFLDEELAQAIYRLTEVNLTKDDEIFRKVEVRLIKKIQAFLNGPEVEKEYTKRSIEQLLG
jgi:hypothetical protein